VDTSMGTNAKLSSEQREDFDNPDRYQRLVEKLNYLMVYTPDIPLYLVWYGYTKFQFARI